MTAPPTIARIALDVPVFSLFDYRCDGLVEADIGRRALVPFGKKSAVGVIVDLAHTSAVSPQRLKQITSVLRDEPGLSTADLELIRFASAYYHSPLGAVISGAMPARLRRPTAAPRKDPEGRYALTAAGAAADLSSLPSRAVARRLMETLAAGALDHDAVRRFSRQALPALEPLIERGWVKLEARAQAQAAVEGPVPPPLTGEQASAASGIVDGLGGYQPYLLLGVPGSGKTEVYLHAIAAVLERGRQALVLVPEIALTPQLEGLVGARFPGVLVATLHSGMSEGERLAHWLAAHSARARIVLGTRLAVFAPLPELGLIVVDEEHDASFKQAEGFRYSARDLAVVRARQRAVPVVLGSATPALETYYNAVTGRYRLLALTRPIGAPPPSIHCLDSRPERPREGLTSVLLKAIAGARERGEQSLVFINRRGFAPVLTCRSCGWISGCHRCAAQLVLHLEDKRLRCHHCGHEAVLPASCPHCGNQDLAPVGQGTQRVEAALAAQFGRERLLRIDRDSVRRRDAWPTMRRSIERREVDILVGTQILAKGHDFPHLNLVGVLNADSLLYSADFRAAERLFALLTQVAGRAGRGAIQGRVLIQTEFPEHPLYQALKLHDYRAFADALLAERRQAGFPPFVHQALLRAEAPRLETAIEFLTAAARQARKLAPEVTIYDPVPAALPRRAGRERAQLLVQSESRASLQQFLRDWHGELATGRSTPARWSLDVDPLEF